VFIVKGAQTTSFNKGRYRGETQRLRARLVGYSILGIFAINTTVATACFLPLYQHLRRQQEQWLADQAINRAMAIDRHLQHTEDIAAQITSRTRIREALEDYNHQKITLAQLQEFSEAKLLDALRTADNILAINRYNPNQQLVIQVKDSQRAAPYATDLQSMVPTIITVAEPTVELEESFQSQEVFLIQATVPIRNPLSQAIEEDITAQKEAQDALEYEARHDALTGLLNRQQALLHLEQVIHQANHQNAQGYIFFIDLDGFKAINDTYGHDIGDKLLVALAKRLQNSLRDSDLTARLGGDEFLVILPTLDYYWQAETIAQKVLKTLTDPVALGDIILTLSGSLGMVRFPRQGLTAQDLIHRADVAMYQAKRTGNGRWCLFREDMLEATSLPNRP
jgi:diguanylate cyclase (GGDEF)-like protein